VECPGDVQVFPCDELSFTPITSAADTGSQHGISIEPNKSDGLPRSPVTPVVDTESGIETTETEVRLLKRLNHD
jgi:hypothetical protein